MKVFLLTAFLTFFSFSSALLAQAHPIKWGKVSKEDIEMKTYEADSTAEAVVLCDYGYISFELNARGGSYRFSRHKRIKILKSSGFELGNIEIPYYASSNVDRVTGLKAQVFTPDGEKHGVDKKSIYTEERSKNVFVKKFACPKIEEGAIIEYKYEFTSSRLVGLEDWYFQGSYPVRWSELRLEMPEWFNYLVLFQGQDGLSVKEEKNESRSFSGVRANTKIARYVMENAPALRREAFITTMNDYRARIQFQLNSLNFPGDIERPYLSSWVKLAETLLDDEDYGGQFRKKRFSKSLIEASASVVEGLESPSEKAVALYEFIAKNVEWNGKYRVYSYERIDKAFEKGSANSSEMNFMLLALFKAHKIEAYPLLLSTRDHGRMITTYPVFDQFNHTMILAILDGKEVLMDVGNPDRPIGYPRINALNREAWVVHKTRPRWISVDSPSGSETFFGVFDIDEEGTLTGEVKCNFVGYEGVYERAQMKGETEELKKVWKERFTDDFPETTIKEAKLENESMPYKPLKYMFKCEIEEAAQANGNFIYVNPMLYKAYSENPLKLEKRTYPVDIPYPSKAQYIFNLNIPAGYVVEELPEPISMVLPNKGGKFTYVVSENGGKIQIVSKIKIDQLMFFPEEYESIKYFFDTIIEKQSQQLILKKSI